MQDAESGLVRLYECVAGYQGLDRNENPAAPSVITDKEAAKLGSLEQRFQQAMDNDFNSAQAIGLLFEGAKIINKIMQKLPPEQSEKDLLIVEKSVDTLVRLAQIMGLLTEPARQFLAERKQSILENIAVDEATITRLIDQRYEARKQKKLGAQRPDPGPSARPEYRVEGWS